MANYNIVYIVDGKIKETIEYNKPIALCKYIKNKKEKSNNYKHGLITFIKN